jgi:transposase-like protein
MSKFNKYSAAEKLSILQEIEMGEATLLEIAKKYEINRSSLINWRHRYEVYGYNSLEIRTGNKRYSAELKISSCAGLSFRKLFAA